jgi:hypothetical protein
MPLRAESLQVNFPLSQEEQPKEQAGKDENSSLL